MDLATLQADAPDGTYHADSIEPAYVGAVDSDLFIGVIFDPDVAAEQPQAVRAYLCDGESVVQWVTGEIDSSGAGVLVSDDDPRIRVELDADGEVSGNVRLGDEYDQSFTAEAATGDAGLYRAVETFDGDDEEEFVEDVGGWIVLPDGRQAGGGCERICVRDPRTGRKICGPCRQK